MQVQTAGGRQPRTIIAFGENAPGALGLIEMARKHCELIWLVAPDDRHAQALTPLLARSGTVVPLLGEPVELAQRALAPLAPTAIITYFDFYVEQLAAIAEAMSLPFFSPQTARCLADKGAQREALRVAGLDTPAVMRIPAGTTGGELLARAQAFGYPLVFKPSRASGSRQAFKIDDLQALQAAIAVIGDTTGEERVFEGYLSDGPELPGGFAADYVSVETAAYEGRLTPLAITGKFPTVTPLRETGGFMPAVLPAGAAGSVIELTHAALRAIDFRDGVAHTEIKLTVEGPRVLEINGRVGGTVADMFAIAAGIDLLEVALRIALREDPQLPEMPALDGIAYEFMYQPPVAATRLLALDGLNELRVQPGVCAVAVKRGRGARLDVANGTMSYLFNVCGRARSIEQLLTFRDRLASDVHPVYEYAAAGVEDRTMDHVSVAR